MPLILVRNDITRMAVDAVVNAAGPTLRGHGGVCGAIHKAAGRELKKACKALGGCRVGEAKITEGFRLPCRYIIHTVGPVWQGGEHGEETLLRSCYRQSLELAVTHALETVAFPLISSGSYGVPSDAALRVATDSITDFLNTHDLTVYLVLFDKETTAVATARFSEVASFIDDHYVDVHPTRPGMQTECMPRCAMPHEDIVEMAPVCECAPPPMPTTAHCIDAASPSFDFARFHIQLPEPDESFSQMLLRKIDESGMTDAQCYKKANIDRKLFSKIRSDIHYKPSKPTVIAFAVALELSLEETEEMLKKAGFALSHSNKFDLIIEYFLQRRCYDIFTINEALFSFDQCLLGS